MTKNNLLYGLILSGGKSSRMGRDKATILYHGKSQLEFLYELLQKVCKRVFVSCKHNTSPANNIPCIVDQFDFETPLNGIASAFKQFPNVSWLTVPIDMPNITVETLQCLIKNRDYQKLATCFYDSEGKNPEPLVALWESTASSHLQNYISAGGKSPREFLQRHSANLIDVPDQNMLININDPDELMRFFEQNGKTLPH